MTTVIFVNADGTRHEIDATDGTSLMQVAIDNGVDSILGECGGACSCATCHGFIDDAWLEKVGPATDIELDMLEGAIDPKPSSRLCCQVEVTPELDGVVIHLPESQF
jgi:2Fe-2S ferredoxin